MDSESNVNDNNKIDEKFNHKKNVTSKDKHRENFFKKIYIFENRIYEDIDNIDINLENFIEKITKKTEKYKYTYKNKNIRDKIKKINKLKKNKEIKNEK